MAVKAPPKLPELPVHKIDPLENWGALTSEIHKKGEAELWELLEREKLGLCRHSFVTRLYGRANKLRTKRESGELSRLILLKEATK